MWRPKNNKNTNFVSTATRISCDWRRRLPRISNLLLFHVISSKRQLNAGSLRLPFEYQAVYGVSEETFDHRGVAARRRARQRDPRGLAAALTWLSSWQRCQCSLNIWRSLSGTGCRFQGRRFPSEKEAELVVNVPMKGVELVVYVQ